MTGTLYRRPAPTDAGPEVFLGDVVAVTPPGRTLGEVTFTVLAPHELIDAYRLLFCEPHPVALSAVGLHYADWAFHAVVVGLDVEFPHSGEMVADLTFKVASQPPERRLPKPQNPRRDISATRLEERVDALERRLDRLTRALAIAGEDHE